MRMPHSTDRGPSGHRPKSGTVVRSLASPVPPRVSVSPSLDLNARIAGLLGDLAAIQTIRPKTQAYRHAAAVVFSLPAQLDEIRAAGPLPKIAGIGPSSLRVIEEVLATGASAKVETAIDVSGKRADVDRRRTLRDRFFSRAEVVRLLKDPSATGVGPADCRADFQMHSEWSDGAVSLPVLARACAARGYTHAGISDHAGGLSIAGGMSSADIIAQHREIDALNAAHSDFILLKGVEANIDAAGGLDLTADELASFDLVLAAPHARLRTTEDQTARMMRVLDTPGVHILAHPTGRKRGERAGIVADWDAIFARAAKRKIAIEIDGDPSRQDVDFAMATRAREAGCLFALDSDAHRPDQLVFAETAIAHARLAGIPAARVINCWPLAKLQQWARAR